MADCMSERTLNEQMESLAEILPPIESNIDDYGKSDRDKVENFSLSSPEIIYIYTINDQPTFYAERQKYVCTFAH